VESRQPPLPKLQFIRARACYKGRVAIYEVLEMSPMIKEILLRHGSTDEIKRQGIKEGMKTLRMCALTKVAQGLTTVDEAVTNSASDKM
jgi:type IV pilus assembly protein PilB